MEDEQSIEGSDKSFTRSWKFLKDAVRKRLEPKSRRISLGSSAGSGTELAADASQITRSSSSAVKQRMAKGPLSALYKPKAFKAPSTKSLLDEVGNREGSQFELMLDRALSLKRHDSMDLMWRSGDLGLFGSANTQVQGLPLKILQL
ncbi:MAG: hypothetical protein FRX49_05776 [Trebouxia sp. A1-2]|nr:MAG: hypothetical protein FRX49_05776 [Trebouxia sp. A1-2]